MTPDTPIRPPADVPTQAMPAPGQSVAIDPRWAAWQARGAAHDRAFRRRLAIVGPAALLLATLLYVLLVR